MNATIATLAALFIATSPLATSPLAAQTIAITGGTVFPVSRPKIENATILIRDGQIVAVGTDVTIPDGATRIDATGKWITPGLIHAATDVGLNGVGSLDQTREGSDTGAVSAAFNVAEGINPAAVQIPIARIEGVTTAIAIPVGGLIAGQAVAFDLAGDNLEAMLVRSPVAMAADVSQSAKASSGGSRASVMLRLRLLLRDAMEYARRKMDFRSARIQPLSAPAIDLEALAPVLNGSEPLYVEANRRSDIENALRLREEFPKLRLIIRGGLEAWQMAPALARAKVPVVVESRTDVPTFDGLGARLDNGALLRKAGVTVLLVEGGPQFDDPINPRNLRQVAGNAVRSGMTWDDALRAVTLAPAEAFGVSERYGSLDAGKVANIVIWSGDPFDFPSGVERLFIRGVEIPLTSRMTELRDRYRTLPPKY